MEDGEERAIESEFHRLLANAAVCVEVNHQILDIISARLIPWGVATAIRSADRKHGTQVVTEDVRL